MSTFAQQHLYTDAQGNARENLVIKTADATLGLNEANVLVTVGASNVTMTLPPVSEAMGFIFVIDVDETGAGNCIVADNDDSIGWSDLTSSADGYLVLLCTGRRWINVASSNFA